MGAENFNFRVVMHHVQHLAIYSLVIWQITLAVWLLLRWAAKNFKFSSNVSPLILGDLLSQAGTEGVKLKKEEEVKKAEIDIDAFMDVKATIPDAKVGTTALKSEKQKVKDTGTDVADKLKKLRSKK